MASFVKTDSEIKLISIYLRYTTKWSIIPLSFSVKKVSIGVAWLPEYICKWSNGGVGDFIYCIKKERRMHANTTLPRYEKQGTNEKDG